MTNETQTEVTKPTGTLNEYKGYSLFNDVEDAELRTRNRATVMSNIIEDNLDKGIGKITARGTLLVLNYYMSLPKTEMLAAQAVLADIMKEKGFANAK